MESTITNKNMSARQELSRFGAVFMRTAFAFSVAIIVMPMEASGQVPTQAEIGTSKLTEQSRPGYYFYAKPFEVTMTVNLWGEVPQQGVYVVATNTDIIQLVSYAGGPREKSNLEEVLIYRASGRKDVKARTLKKINLREILEGNAPTVPLAPGDMIVMKKLSEALTWQEILTIVNTGATLAVLGVTIYTMTKK